MGKIRKKLQGVYLIQCRINGKKYIGSSTDVYDRFKYHKNQTYYKYQPNHPMYKEIKEFGLENFDFMFILFVDGSKEDLRRAEQEFITLLQPEYNRMPAYVPPEVQREKYLNYQRQYKHTEHYKQEEYKRNHTEARKLQKRLWKAKQDHKLCLFEGQEMTFRKVVYILYKRGEKKAMSKAKAYIIEK